MSGSKSKIAVTLLGALAFGANAQAMNLGVKDDKPRQTLGAVREAAPQVKKGMPLAAKVVFSVLGTLGIVEFGHSMVGGLTNSKFGRYSLGRLIKNHVNKNKQPDLGEQDNENPNEQNNEEKNEEKDENLNAVLEKFKAADPSAFNSNKNKIIDFYKKIINKKYKVGENINKSCEEAVNSIISFMNTPNVENGLKIEFNGSYRFAFKDIRYNIQFALDDKFKIIGFGKIILNTTK